MKICIIFGAGASLANAQYFHRDRKRATNPPLDYTFFDKVKDLGLTVPTDLKHYASMSPGQNPFNREFGVPRVRMEEFFRELYFEFQEARGGGLASRAYQQLLELYLGVLRITTNWIGDDARTGGPIGSLIAASASVASELNLITFNHDLIIENEIVKRARLRRKWCLEAGYGSIGTELHFTAPRGTRHEIFPGHTTTCNHAITLLKLHGSLNWYVISRGKYPARSVLIGGGSPVKISCTNRRFIPTQFQSMSGRRTGRTSWYTWPVVIPPVQGKENLIRTFLRPVWVDAERALKNADRIVSVGYSLPVLDVHAERLVRRSLAGNRTAKWIDVVNPAPDAAARYASVASPMSVRWHASLTRFLSSERA